jgi:hypothetical protein
MNGSVSSNLNRPLTLHQTARQRFSGNPVVADSKTHFAPQKRHTKYSGRAFFRPNHDISGLPRLFKPACPYLSWQPRVMAMQSEHFMQALSRLHPYSSGNDLRGGEYRRHRQFLVVSLLARGIISRKNSRLMLWGSHRRDGGTEIRVWLLEVEEVLAWRHRISPFVAILIVGQLGARFIAAYQAGRSEPNRPLQSPTYIAKILADSSHGIPEGTMKPGNYWHFSQGHARREVNTPVILLIAGLGGFWITVAFLVFA